MKQIGLFIGFLAVMAFMLPGLPAQDEKKKDVEKTEKKDPEKKDDKKDPEKKAEKKAEPKKEKLLPHNKFQTKILGFKGDSNRDLTIETMVRDDKKVQDVNAWAAQQQGQLSQQAVNAQKGDFKARAAAMQAYQKSLYSFQAEMAKKNVMSPKSMEVHAHETAKVRALTLPPEFEDNGKIKVWTKKELEERKDKTGLPGYPVEFDALKSGQYVEIYIAKAAPMTKKKKGPDDDDPPPMKERNEFVLIVILQDPK